MFLDLIFRFNLLEILEYNQTLDFFRILKYFKRRDKVIKTYKEYREKNNIKQNTIKYEVEQLETFLAFVAERHEKRLESFEITPSDIRAYLDFQKTVKQVKDNTLKRKLSVIRQYFHFLWKSGKVPYDFMPKFEYKFNVPEKIGYTNYQDLVDRKESVLSDARLILNDKLYFLFAMIGIKMKDIEELKMQHLKDQGDHIVLLFTNSNNYVVEYRFDNPVEIGVLLQAIERSMFREHDILVGSTNQKEPNYIRGNLKEIYNRLESVLGQPFKGEEIRLSYIHYMYKIKQMTIEEMSETLGASVASIASTLKVVLERYKHIDYNKATN